MLRIVLKATALSIAVLVLAPMQWVALRLAPGRARLALPRLFHRIACAVLGLQVESCGVAADGPCVVFVSNHLSYLDIPVIGAILDARFVAKDDIIRWPVLGSLARLQRTVFVRRDPRGVRAAGAAMGEAVANGDSLVLFAEGTTSDGSTVLPFKSSALSGFVEPHSAARVLQPITLSLLSVDGECAADATVRDRYAYYADMRMGRHLLDFMAGRGAQLRMTLHPPVPVANFTDRKALASHLRQRVQQGLDGAPGCREPAR